MFNDTLEYRHWTVPYIVNLSGMFFNNEAINIQKFVGLID